MQLTPTIKLFYAFSYKIVQIMFEFSKIVLNLQSQNSQVDYFTQMANKL